MPKRFSFINFLIAIIFLLTTIFPSGAFSYQSPRDSDRIDKWVDESYGQDVETFKKVRCPNCHMEFFYVPNREGPHSHFVQYESKIQPEDKDADKEDIDLEAEFKNNPDKFKDIKKQARLLNLFKFKDSAKETQPKDVKQAVKKSGASNLPESVEYKLRQELTCPYDSYKFFPEGDIIEDGKFKPGAMLYALSSPIESSFSNAISIGSQRDLRQFGYELFIVSEKSKEEEEKAASPDSAKSLESLAAFSMLKAGMGGQSGQGFNLSSGVSSEDTAIIPISSDYIVGPGDMLIINIWGSVQE